MRRELQAAHLSLLLLRGLRWRVSASSRFSISGRKKGRPVTNRTAWHKGAKLCKRALRVSRRRSWARPSAPSLAASVSPRGRRSWLRGRVRLQVVAFPFLGWYQNLRSFRLLKKLGKELLKPLSLRWNKKFRYVQPLKRLKR